MNPEEVLKFIPQASPAKEKGLREQLIEVAAKALQRGVCDLHEETGNWWGPGQECGRRVGTTAVDALLPIIEARDKQLAKEFRRWATDYRHNAHDLDAHFGDRSVAMRWRVRAETFEQAAQMLEEKLT